jgi:hypothetical protein
MKDYYDLWTLSQHFPFEGRTLCDALCATLTRRGRPAAQNTATGLSDTFATDPTKIRQWKAFLGSRVSLDIPADLATVVNGLRNFAGPIIDAVARNGAFDQCWDIGGPWKSEAR